MSFSENKLPFTGIPAVDAHSLSMISHARIHTYELFLSMELIYVHPKLLRLTSKPCLCFAIVGVPVHTHGMFYIAIRLHKTINIQLKKLHIRTLSRTEIHAKHAILSHTGSKTIYDPRTLLPFMLKQFESLLY